MAEWIMGKPTGIKQQCIKCHQSIAIYGLAKHFKNCTRTTKKLIDKIIYKQIGDKLECPQCYKLYHKNGISAHFRIVHVQKGKTTFPAWNKGLTAQTSKIIMAGSIKCSKTTLGRSGNKHTSKAKQKISLARRAYLKSHPDQVPYLLNHSSRESYPEIYFASVFQNEKIFLAKEFQVGIYRLDFADIENKIDIEIDGDQHYLDKKIVASDARRNKYLEELGWKIIRIKWSTFRKLKYNEKRQFLETHIFAFLKKN